MLFSRLAMNIYFWMGFLIIPEILSMGNLGHAEDHYHTNFRAQALFALFYSIIIYFNNLYLLPRFFQRRQYLIYFIVILGLITFWAILQAKYDYLVFGCNCLLPLTGNRFGIAGLQISLFVVGFSGFKIIRDYIKKEDEFKELDTIRLENELKFLKGQINPHFLFNTLNSLYAFALERSDKVPEFVLRLSDIMRYMLYESNERFVPLEKELNYLYSYIELHKMRMEDRGIVFFEQKGEVGGFFIAPHLLINFVENCFKHSEANHINNILIKIWVEVKDNELYFYSENNLSDSAGLESDASAGIGLNNTKKRLELLYPDQYSLNLSQEDSMFKTRLTIQLSPAT